MKSTVQCTDGRAGGPQVLRMRSQRGFRVYNGILSEMSILEMPILEMLRITHFGMATVVSRCRIAYAFLLCYVFHRGHLPIHVHTNKYLVQCMFHVDTLKYIQLFGKMLIVQPQGLLIKVQHSYAHT